MLVNSHSESGEHSSPTRTTSADVSPTPTTNGAAAAFGLSSGPEEEANRRLSPADAHAQPGDIDPDPNDRPDGELIATGTGTAEEKAAVANGNVPESALHCAPDAHRDGDERNGDCGSVAACQVGASSSGAPSGGSRATGDCPERERGSSNSECRYRRRVGQLLGLGCMLCEHLSSGVAVGLTLVWCYGCDVM